MIDFPARLLVPTRRRRLTASAASALPRPAAKKSWHVCAAIVLAATLFANGSAATPCPADEPPPKPAANPASVSGPSEAGEQFLEHVWPLLQKKCLGCHGDGRELGGNLDLRTRAALLRGGDGGPAIKPGHAVASLLISAVRWRDELKMPPQERNRLTDAEVKRLEEWIAAGAPWPARRAAPAASTATTGAASDDLASSIIVETSAGLSPDWNQRRYPRDDVWAYRPLTVASPPLGHAHPIDGFVLQGLDAIGLEPAGRADPATLVRRAALDLWGLIPTPDESESLARLIREDVPDSWENVVDRLLADARYGEQQARHWLDVTRYADSSGFSNDYERPHAWRWRDYVIRSFNSDKPFDRFIREQIAGDELAPDDPEMRIAVGFLRMGPWEHTGMSVAAVTRQQFLDDVTHAVGVTFQGQALRCAACHDHKFDPIPTRDYYRLQAVFAPAQFAELETPFLPAESYRGNPDDIARLRRLLHDAQTRRAALEAKNRRAVAELLAARGVAKISDLPANEQTNARFFGLTEQEKSEDKILQKASDYFQRSLLRYEPYAMSVYSGAPNGYTSTKARNPEPPANKRDGEIPTVRILLGGALEAPGDAVTPGVLSAVASNRDAAGEKRDKNDSAGDDASAIPDQRTGRRMALASWIASPRNTLTARVIVNRIWQQHFGQGIVGTPNNLGVSGAKPTHPELLDWMARWLVEHQWSLKSLHRLVLTSEAYCRSSSSEHEELIARLDPKRQWLAVFPARRMAAEELRDSLLVASGEWNRTMGGPPAEPELHWEVALQPRHVMGSVAPAYQPAPRRADRHRRTIYTLRVRTLPDPMLEVFNRPGPDISCDRRDTTTVTPQVFSLWNGQFAHDRALALADRAIREAASTDERLDRVFLLVLGRLPSESERTLCREHVARMTEFHATRPPRPHEPPTNVQREMIEELTGETVQWQEQLDRMFDFQPDLKPWQVDPETRAWADLCLVLLNTNEFVYIR